jgi:putative acetyltransferase
MLELVTIAPVPISSADAVGLIAQLDMELARLYPDLEHSHSELTSDQLSPGNGIFLIARSGTEPIGCGALRRLNHSAGEIRRMFVLPTARGARVGRRILAELERYARQNGLNRLTLVTGARQPDAIRLYEHSGYIRIPSPSEYGDTPIRICMAKVLDYGTQLGRQNSYTIPLSYSSERLFLYANVCGDSVRASRQWSYYSNSADPKKDQNAHSDLRSHLDRLFPLAQCLQFRTRPLRPSASAHRRLHGAVGDAPRCRLLWEPN